MLANGDSQGPNARSGGRLRVCGVTSDLGPVLDLSQAGMRAAVKGKPKMHERLCVRVMSDGITVAVEARVVWMKRRGLWRYEVGVEFIDMTDEQRQQIRELVRTGMASADLARDAA